MDLPEGTCTILEVHIFATPLPTVTWFKDGQPLAGNEDYVITNYENIYSVKIKKLNKTSHSGRYVCKASNPAGEVESAANITVVCESAFSVSSSRKKFILEYSLMNL